MDIVMLFAISVLPVKRKSSANAERKNKMIRDRFLYTICSFSSKGLFSSSTGASIKMAAPDNRRMRKQTALFHGNHLSTLKTKMISIIEKK